MESPLNNKEVSQEDIEKNKTIAVLAYFIFFLPLLAARESRFAMYHANQGLVLFLAAVAVNIVGSFLPFMGWYLILSLVNLAVLVLAVIGIINAAKGEMKSLPLIGSISILK